MSKRYKLINALDYGLLFYTCFQSGNKNNRKKPHITEFRTVFLDDVGNKRIFFSILSTIFTLKCKIDNVFIFLVPYGPV